MPTLIPRVVVAAPGSGHGKTSVAIGLLAAYAAGGLQVSAHKVGPDYIDPGYHALAAGRVGRNLDPYLCGPERVAPLFLHGATSPRTADVAVVEGVMGLFDGAVHPGGDTCREGFASTAHVARLLQAPIVFVVDAAAQGASVAALVRGFDRYCPGIRLGGVVLNRVGSPRHEQLLRSALAGIGMQVLGVLRRRDELATPSRHLGLVPAAERSTEARATVHALASAVGRCLDLAAILRLARSAPPVPGPAWDPAAAVAAVAPVVRRPAPPRPAQHRRRPLVAVASGAAFSFGYAETTELLAAAGADVTALDPLRDERLPAGTSALVIGGGFPETHAGTLSENASLRAEVAQLAGSGAPVAAECAGLLYLSRTLDGRPMCGVLDVEARMGATLSLGYRDAVAVTSSVLAAAGTRVRGHEFHRTVCEPVCEPVGVRRAGEPAALPGARPAWQWAGHERGPGTSPPPAGPTREGFVRGGVHASYLHTHWAGAPSLPASLVAACR